MTGLELAAGAAVLWLLGKGKGGAASSSKGSAKETKVADAVDKARLVTRAHQVAASDWVHFLVSQDAPQGLAEGIARWIGLESSGNSAATSKLNERGLIQVQHNAVDQKRITELEWAAMTNPFTTKEEQARIAIKLVNSFWNSAKAKVTNPPTDYASGLWYAKLYHQRPVDVRDGKLHGDALPMAKELQVRWAKDPKKLHRLRAANVVAFGQPEV